MNVASIKFNCYIEGIRVPLIKHNVMFNRSTLSEGDVTIPLANFIEVKAFASAFVQITYILNNKEKLFYEGICTDLVLEEEQNMVQLMLKSKFSVFNYNTTLDYMSPKKYGLQNLDEGIKIYLGNEDATSVAISDFESSSNLSDRYFFVVDENIEELDPSDPDSNKLFYVMNRFPFAERFAFSFFEDIAYKNFFLTKAYVDRFNLLAKTKGKRVQISERLGEESLQNSIGYEIRLDVKRSGLDYKHDRETVSKRGCASEPDSNIYAAGQSLTHSGFTNFRLLMANDPRAQYVDTRSASPESEQYCTPSAGEAMLKAAQLIYSRFATKLIVGDISIANSNKTGFIGTGWGPHNDHKVGQAADLYIPGATNSQTSDYDFNKSIECMKIFFSVGAQWIAFQDPKRQNDLSRLTGGVIKNISGHTNHYHVQF